MMLRCGVLVVAGIFSAPSAIAAQEPQVPTAPQVRAAAARGDHDAAWSMVARMPVDRDTVSLAVELALASGAPTVAPERLPLLADRAARLSIDSNSSPTRLAACAVVTQLDGSVPCAQHLQAVLAGHVGTVLDRLHAWRALAALGAKPSPLSAGWPAELRGSSALEVAAWSDLPSADRVRLLEPLLQSQDIGTQIAARSTLLLIPGPEALAVWRSLAAAPGPAPFPGASTQVMVGLARHGDPEATKTLAPVESQLSPADRLVLAIGRVERRDPAGRAALVTMVLSGAEMEAVRAAEALAAIGPEPRIEGRVRGMIRDGGAPLRLRWLDVALRLKLGHTPEVVKLLADESEDTRVAAALAVAAVAAR